MTMRTMTTALLLVSCALAAATTSAQPTATTATTATTTATATATTTTTTASAPLGLDEVWQRSAAVHPSLLAASADVDAGDGLALAAEGAFDPALRAGAAGGVGNYQSARADAGASAFLPFLGARVDGGWRLGIGDFPVYDGKEKTNDFGEVQLGLRVPLLRDLLVDERRAGVLRQDLEASRRRAALAMTQLDLQRAAASAWFDWVVAGVRRDVSRDLLALAEARDGQLKQRADAGDVPAIEVKDNARLIAQRRQRVIAADRAVERAALTLALYLRDDDGAPVIPGPERLPVIPGDGLQAALTAEDDAASAGTDVDDERGLEAVIADARKRRPELIAQRVAIEQALVDERLGDNQLLPGLSVGAKVSQDLGGTHAPLSTSSSVWNPDGKTRGLPDASVDLRFEVPVPQRQARGRALAAQAAVRRAEATLRLLEDRIGLDARDAWQARRAARLRAESALVEEEAADAVLQGERQRFDAGDSTLVVVNLREVALAEAKLAAAEARLDMARARVALRLIAGTTPAGG